MVYHNLIAYSILVIRITVTPPSDFIVLSNLGTKTHL